MAQKASKDDVLLGVRILELANEFGIAIEQVTTGNFDCRCKCPSTEHKSGEERTGSLYIDSVNNNFYCFGCNASNNCIDFYMLCTDIDFVDAINELRTRVKPSGKEEKIHMPAVDNFTVLLGISTMFRETMNRHRDDLKWISELMKYSDKFIFELDSADKDGAKELSDKIQKAIYNRYKAD